jgi:hypothetical protein
MRFSKKNFGKEKTQLKEIDSVRSGVIKWVACLMVAQTGVIVTISMLMK